MRYLREQLDDPDAVDCGRCDNCGGLSLSPPSCEPRPPSASARPALAPGVAIEPRKMWPTALANLGLDLKGKIGTGPAEGRAIARLTDLGHGQALRELFAAGVPDGPVPPSLAQGLMTVMKDWSGEWAERPVALVHVESATRPQLVADLAAGLARVMQLPVVGTWAIVDPSVAPGRGATNSAQRVAAVHGATSCAPTSPRARCCSSTTSS